MNALTLLRIGATSVILTVVFALSVFSQAASCYSPGNVIVADPQDLTILPHLDIEKLHAAEPIYGDGSQILTLSMKMRHLRPDLPGLSLPLGTWNIIYTTSTGTSRFVRMSTLLGSPTFSYGNVTFLLGVPIYNEVGPVRGTLGNDGLMTIYIDKSLIGNPPAGTQYTISGRTYLNTLGVGLVQTDDSAATSYQLVGNGGCTPWQFVGFGQNGDVPVSNDYNRNGTSDYAVWRPESGVWFTYDGVTAEFNVTQHGSGTLGDIPVPGNYDNDNKGDFMVYRPAIGTWFLRSTETGAFSAKQFGIAEDMPMSGDFDGDRVDDIVVWRPSNGVWYVLTSADSTFMAAQFGASEDRPFVGDFDGDRRSDIGVFRPSTGVWFHYNMTGGNFQAVQWGLGTDVIAPGDYDGDGKLDQAVFRPSTGVWYIRRSGNGAMDTMQWGLSTDRVVPGDYNGNGRSDYAVWRPSNGVWYVHFR